MITNFEQESIQDLKKRKSSLRRYLLNLSPTEKIKELELLQRRNYEILRELEKNGGRKVPDVWQKWREAQDF